jgi:hypothetical protein
MANEQALILRDNSGNYFVISADVIGQSQVSDQQKAQLEEALKGDTSGFLFDTAFLSNVTNLTQANNASANNIALGVFAVGPQTVLQLQNNAANVGTAQSANP